MSIERYRLTRYVIPAAHVIGDSQVEYDTLEVGSLELESSTGHTGLGFFHSWAPLAELERVFAASVAPWLLGESPFAVTNRLERPRGGNIRPAPFAAAVVQAAFDLQGKELGLPLYRLLGGTRNRVPAYASGIEFRLPLEEACELFRRAVELGFTAFKFKVGHPDLRWDLERLAAFKEVVGPDATLMVDANEAWSPKEAIRRLHAYREAGFDIFWVEDPCLRDDYEGLARVAREVPFTQVNAGEYLDLRGKWQLLEHRAVEVLNVHGHLVESLQAGRLATQYGIPISLGNTPLDIGLHVAAALPEVLYIEWSMLGWEALAEEPYRCENGCAIVPDRPGHGLTLSEEARAELARAE